MNLSTPRSRFKLLVCVFLVAFNAKAQKLTSDKGEVSFTSNASLELINATSHKIQGIVDPATGAFAFIVKGAAGIADLVLVAGESQGASQQEASFCGLSMDCRAEKT